MRTLLFTLAALLFASATAQTTYNYTIPSQFDGVNSYVEFTFPATPPTTGDATLTLNWLACHQSGFGGSSITVQISTSNGWVTILNESDNYLECILITETVTITGAMMADAIATGGGQVLCRVDCDDSCQAGVGCSFYNDPVVSGINLTYTAHAANFTVGDASVCPGSTVQFTDASINTPSSYEWHFPGATPSSSTAQNPLVQYPAPGNYDVTLIVVTLDGADTLVMNDLITVYTPPLANAGIDESVCAGASAQLQASGGVAYEWFPASGLNDANIANPVATPGASTSYTVLVTDANGCQANDYMVLSVQPLPVIVASAGNNTICLGDTAYIVATGAQLYQWSPNLFISTTVGPAVFAWPTSTFTWDINGTDGFGCSATAEVTITVVPPPTAPIVSMDGPDVTTTTTASGYQWFLNGQVITGATGQSWTPLVNGNYSVSITDANGCSSQSLPVYYGSVDVADQANTAVRIYPQPAKSEVVIEGVQQRGSARLFDATGREVLRFRTSGSGRDEFNVGGLAAGTYTLEVPTPSGVRTFPFVKEQ